MFAGKKASVERFFMHLLRRGLTRIRERFPQGKPSLFSYSAEAVHLDRHAFNDMRMVWFYYHHVKPFPLRQEEGIRLEGSE